MSSVNSSVTLSELCFPDITGKTIKSWMLVTFSSGNYTPGGIPFGLIPYADARTVDFNGFLKCNVNSEEPFSAANATGQYTYRYSPVGDVIQIFGPGATGPGGAELAAGAIPAEVLADTIIAEAFWNRTTVLG